MSHDICPNCQRPKYKTAKLCRKCWQIERTQTIEERFWSKVDVRGPHECWPWLGGTDKYGYGRINSGGKNGTPLVASHVALELDRGYPLAPGELACHTCDNPPCCNPVHLFAGTHKDNADDMIRKGRGITGDRHPHRTRGTAARGEQNGRVKLTTEQVLSIRANPDKPTKEIAIEYSITRWQARNILARRSWKHV